MRKLVKWTSLPFRSRLAPRARPQRIRPAPLALLATKMSTCPGRRVPAQGVLNPAPEPCSGNYPKFVRADSVPQYVLLVRPVGLRPARSHGPRPHIAPGNSAPRSVAACDWTVIAHCPRQTCSAFQTPSRVPTSDRANSAAKLESAKPATDPTRPAW